MMDRRFRRALFVGVAAALLAGCSNSQPPTGAPGVMPQSHIATTETDLASKPHGYNHTLLYVSGGEALRAYKYPKGKRHGSVGYFGSTDGLCADTAGDIFLSSAEGVYEYAHDGASPIATLSVRGACSVDPVTGNLAVCSGPAVAIFHYSPQYGWLIPKDRIASFNVRNCGYDNQGNLFVAGVDSGSAFQFAELPAKSQTFTTITLDRSISGPGQVQWDGSYITIEDNHAKPSVLHRFSISGSMGYEVGSTVLKGTKMVGQFWIQSNKVVGSTSDSSVGVWAYPSGGKPLHTIAAEEAYGVTVSVAPHQ